MNRHSARSWREHILGRTEGEFVPENIGSGAEKEELRAEGDILGKLNPGKNRNILQSIWIRWDVPGPAFSFNRRQWLSLIKWAHHSKHSPATSVCRLSGWDVWSRKTAGWPESRKFRSGKWSPWCRHLATSRNKISSLKPFFAFYYPLLKEN